MAIYKHSDGSLINEVEIIKNAQGGCRAYLRARSDCTPDQLTAIQQKLVDRNWIGIPCFRDGRAMLEVRGFRQPEEIRAFLQVSGCTNGEPTAMVNTEADKQSFKDKFGAATLKYSGLSYIFGDAAFMFYATRELLQHHKDLKDAEDAVKALNKFALPELSKSEVQMGLIPPAKQAEILKELKTNRSIEKIAGDSKDLRLITTKVMELPGQLKGNITGGHFKIAAGVGYAVGSVILAVFGSKDQSHIQIKNSINQIDRYVKSEGLSDPNATHVLLQEPEKQNKNLFERGHDLLSRYPSEALNFVYTGVGLALMGSSIKAVTSLGSRIKSLKGVAGWERELKDLKQERTTEFIDIGLGSITASASLAGILIKEKKPIEGEKKREGLGGVWDWIEEKPLRLTGAGLMAATGVHAVATTMKWKPFEGETPKELKSRRITLGGRGVFIGVNIVAEILMALSSKGHGEGVKNHDVDDTVIASTAEYISRQNPEVQDSLIQRLAGYMASPEVLGGKSEEIAVNIRAQLEGLKSNPWVHTVKPAQERLAHQQEPVFSSAEPVLAATQQSTGPGVKVQGVQRDGMIQDKQIAAAVS